jgi:hypothetical protein
VGVLELKLDPHGNTVSHSNHHNHSLLASSNGHDKERATILFRDSEATGTCYAAVVDCQDQRANSKPTPYQNGSLVFSQFTAKFNIEKVLLSIIHFDFVLFSFLMFYLFIYLFIYLFVFVFVFCCIMIFSSFCV